jgi:hypothetical protein
MLNANQFGRMAAIAAIFMAPAIGLAQTSPQLTECDSVTLRQKAVSKNGTVQAATVDFATGQLDPTPVLETQIQVLTKGCVFVTFSAQVDPQDNAVVFQASVDNVPMSGHALFPYSTPPIPTPVVWDPEETNLNLSRMVSYTFFAQVNPGVHTVRLRFAGCCSLIPGGNSAFIRNAVMSIRY